MELEVVRGGVLVDFIPEVDLGQMFPAVELSNLVDGFVDLVEDECVMSVKDALLYSVAPVAPVAPVAGVAGVPGSKGTKTAFVVHAH